MFSTSNAQPGVQELLGVREMLEGVHKMVNSLKIFGLGVCGVVIGNFRFRFRPKFRFWYEFRFRFSSSFRFRPKFRFKMQPKTEI